MPLTARRRLKRKNGSISPEEYKFLYSNGTINFSPSDLPWYCQGVTKASANYASTYLSSKGLGVNGNINPHRPSTGIAFGDVFPPANTLPFHQPSHKSPRIPNLNQHLSHLRLPRLSQTGLTSPSAAPVIIYRDPGLCRPNDLTILFSDSSVPGLREICHSDSFLRKIVWFIVFTLLGFLALRDIHQLLSEFYNYPVTVDVRLRESRKLPFPAVTVCNLNIVRFSALCNSTFLARSNYTLPPELKEKLCGTVATTLNITSVEDINDIGDKKGEDEAVGVSATLADRLSPTSPSPTTEKGGGNSGSGNSVGSGAGTSGGIGSASSASIGGGGGSAGGETSGGNLASPSSRSKRQTWRNRGGTGGGGTGNSGSGGGSNNKGPPAINLTANRPQIPPGQRTTTPAYDQNVSQDEIELTEREEKELQENLTTWLAVMANKDKHLTYQLGHQFEQLIQRCTIKSTNCTHIKSFDFSFTPTEGNCFTYRSKTLEGKRHKQVKQEETSLAGVDHGLELVLNLEVAEYLPGTAQVGALVMVHSPDEFGISASEAIFVGPERASYIGLKMIRITRLPSPYPEHCIDHWPEGLTGSLTRNSTYSQQSCLKICLQRTIQMRCRCQSAFLNQFELNDTNLRICDTRRKNTRKCVEEVMLRPESKIDNCMCPPRCQVTQYEKTVSLAKWPTREDRVSFDRGDKTLDFKNLAKVVVYFQTMTMQEVSQQGAWTTAKLLSSLGGFMGMYVGFSFLSLFEVFEVIARRIWYSCTRKKMRFKTIVQTIIATLQYKKKQDSKKLQDQINPF